MCLQQLRIKSVKMPFLFAPNMPKQRAGEFLHSIHNSTHLVICSGTQTREPEGSDCISGPQLQPGRNSRGRCWQMAQRGGVHPLNQPGDLSCCNLLQAENSSKLHLAVQRGQSMEGAEPPESKATIQCLQS